ncbi:MAG TPA: hypothetical protein VFA66_04470 [Gaiellaceae bacterium]|nr:hypothetical protein [Gaiellaceae bacterium]
MTTAAACGDDGAGSQSGGAGGHGDQVPERELRMEGDRVRHDRGDRQSVEAERESRPAQEEGDLGRRQARLAPPPVGAQDHREPRREGELRENDHPDRSGDAERRPRSGGHPGGPAGAGEEQPGGREAESGGREHAEGRECGTTDAIGRKLVGKLLRQLARISEQRGVPLGEVVGGLREDPVVQPAPNADRVKLGGKRLQIRHASTASTARANVFHSRRRTARASRPERVIR